MRESDLWRNASDAEFDNAMEGMEKLVMNKLYDLYILFFFPIPSDRSVSFSDPLAHLQYVHPQPTPAQPRTTGDRGRSRARSGAGAANRAVQVGGAFASRYA